MKKKVSLSSEGKCLYTMDTITEYIPFLIGRYSGLRRQVPEKIDLEYFYPKGRQKLSTALKKWLKKFFDRKYLDAWFPEFAKELSDMYEPKVTVEGFWGDMRKVGSGVYDGGTCFRDGGENQRSREFLEKYHRARVLVLKDPNVESSFARVLCHFMGGRKVGLTNFYWKGMPQKRSPFYKVLGELLGVSAYKVNRSDSGEVGLPIYTNGDARMWKAERSFWYDKERKYTCPACKSKWNLFSDIIHHSDGSVHEIGCTEDCAASSFGQRCYECGTRLDPDNEYYLDDRVYCYDCYGDQC